MNDFIKAEKVVSTALGILEREVLLPNLVWRDAGGDFAGAKGDAITVRLPSYAVANRRKLRSGTTRQKSALHERAVVLTLTEDVYMDVPITDEQLTLDIADFGRQVLNPVLAGVGRELEDILVEKITGATYQNEVEIDYANLKGTIAAARRFLNDAEVPHADRTLLIGSEVEEQIIQLDNFVKANESGTTSTLREATIGKIYGFTVVSSNRIAPGEAYAFHKSAYVLSQRAPVIPAGAPWGATASYAGMAIRTVRVFDPNEVEDRFIADSWCGADIVADQGEYDANGKFVPAEEPEAGGSDALFIRAVKLTPAEVVDPDPGE